MCGLPGDDFGNRDTLFRRFVCEHRPAHYIADGIDIRQAGAAMFVHLDEAAPVDFESDRFRTKVCGIRHASGRHDQSVEFGLLFTHRIGVLDRHRFLGRFDAANLHAEADIQAQDFGENPERLLGHLFIGGLQERRQCFENGHLGTQPFPHAAHFQADDPGADHAQALRDVGQRQCTYVVHDAVIIDGGKRQRPRAGSGRDDHVLGFDRFGVFSLPDFDLITARLAGETPAAVHRRNLVLAEQQPDAAGEGIDDLVLARHHLRHVDGDFLDSDTVLAELVQRALVIFRGFEQRLGRNAADVQAGSAKACLALDVFPVVDANRIQPELRGAYGGRVTARSGSDHCDIKRFGHVCSL